MLTIEMLLFRSLESILSISYRRLNEKGHQEKESLSVDPIMRAQQLKKRRKPLIWIIVTIILSLVAIIGVILTTIGAMNGIIAMVIIGLVLIFGGGIPLILVAVFHFGISI